MAGRSLHGCLGLDTEEKEKWAKTSPVFFYRNCTVVTFHYVELVSDII